MKVVVCCSRSRAEDACVAHYDPTRLPAALAACGIEAVMLDATAGSRDAGASDAHETATGSALDRHAPDIVQTFGYATRVFPVWRAAAARRLPVAHVVTSGGPVGDDPSHLFTSWTRIAPGLRSPTGWLARQASQKVSVLLGSNRLDMAEHRTLGFFPHARQSRLLAPPMPIAPDRTAGRAPGPRRTIPILGYFDRIATAQSLQFVLGSVAMFGERCPLRLAPPSMAQVLPSPRSAAVSVVDTADPEAFVRTIDLLVVPYADDSFTDVVGHALRAGCLVVAPDVGTTAELLDYGRHGVLFKTGSETDLALVLHELIRTWPQSPIRFDHPLRFTEQSRRSVAQSLALIYAEMGLRPRARSPAPLRLRWRAP